jgi:hypothetical protein
MVDEQSEIIPILLGAKKLINAPLSQYMQALAWAYEQEPDNVHFAHLRHGVADVLANTFKNIPANLAPDSYVLRSLGKDELLSATADRFKAPITLIEASPVSKEIRDDLINALNFIIEKVQSLRDANNIILPSQLRS